MSIKLGNPTDYMNNNTKFPRFMIGVFIFYKGSGYVRKQNQK
eukprot:CAMPEP_0185041658 /NCGR_PEP_ID=MMETSP1103-20130426/41266_1 /TAXON_ID=36769 /ORGANISM="Paraphysomonas bandaiensis, Strain Caron Lab Isolate" /LENGTH=41 /DNA_ID= /DNA_START= /DNA_END= /DNA_ORIENTATION=